MTIGPGVYKAGLMLRVSEETALSAPAILLLLDGCCWVATETLYQTPMSPHVFCHLSYCSEPNTNSGMWLWENVTVGECGCGGI